MNSGLILTSAFIGLLLIVLIYLALRELNTWYWKINERIRVQKETNELLQQLIDQNANKKVTE